MMPGGMLNTPPPRTSFRGPTPTINSRPQMYNNPKIPPVTAIPPTIPATFEGPIITVFVGNISERAPDPMVKKILSTCGTVLNWKRVSTFGFCEYELVLLKLII